MTQRSQGVPLAELVAALSLATDLGVGQPMEHALRSCLLGVRLGENLGLDESELVHVYYLALLASIGCTAEAHEMASFFGDDIGFYGGVYVTDMSTARMFRYVLRRLGSVSPPLSRAHLLAKGVRSAVGEYRRSIRARCEVAQRLAARLGFGIDIQGLLGQTFERWDGRGQPEARKGVEVATPVRIVQLAEVAEIFYRLGGVEAAVGVAQARKGTQFDPEFVERFCRNAAALLTCLDVPNTWDAVMDLEPGQRPTLTDGQLDVALEAVADFADLKSPYTAAHSSGVAELAAAAARASRLPESDVRHLRRAALLHDLGRSGVSNAIWEKQGALTDAEWERVRLHPYFTERMLARTRALANLGSLAALHHERLDGSGYHRGMSGDRLTPAASVLAAADAYHAMTEPPPHRAPHRPEVAARELRAEVRAGRLDGEAAAAVLQAAGQGTGRRREWPAGLSVREVEVLRLVARGKSNREMAGILHLSPRTVDYHIRHIYAKIGVTTRAGATLFAMHHGLLGGLVATGE